MANQKRNNKRKIKKKPLSCGLRKGKKITLGTTKYHGNGLRAWYQIYFYDKIECIKKHRINRIGCVPKHSPCRSEKFIGCGMDINISVKGWSEERKNKGKTGHLGEGNKKARKTIQKQENEDDMGMGQCHWNRNLF